VTQSFASAYAWGFEKVCSIDKIDFPIYNFLETDVSFALSINRKYLVWAFEKV
jgi:hypothetical protein